MLWALRSSGGMRESVCIRTPPCVYRQIGGAHTWGRIKDRECIFVCVCVCVCVYVGMCIQSVFCG